MSLKTLKEELIKMWYSEKFYFQKFRTFNGRIIRRISGYTRVKNYSNEAIESLVFFQHAFLKYFEVSFNNADREMCLICREEFVAIELITKLPCLHLYHNDCYSQWEKTRKNCPYCQLYPVEITKNHTICSIKDKTDK